MAMLDLYVYFTSKENIKLHFNEQKSNRWRSKQKMVQDVKQLSIG